jgi:hypothetical protein
LEDALTRIQDKKIRVIEAVGKVLRTMGKLKLKPPLFKCVPISNRQLKVLTWWISESLYHDKDRTISDGSVLASKTVRNCEFDKIVEAERLAKLILS